MCIAISFAKFGVASSIQLLHQLRLLSGSSIFMHQTLCASLIDFLDGNADCFLLVSSVCNASSVSLLDHGLQIALSSLVCSSLGLVYLYSFLCRTNVWHGCAPPKIVIDYIRLIWIVFPVISGFRRHKIKPALTRYCIFMHMERPNAGALRHHD